MNSTAALRGWTERGFRAVLCLSGSWIRIRLPSIDHLLRREVFPHELEAIVIRYAMNTFKLDELDPTELREFLQMKDHLIAYMVRERLVEGADPDAEDAVWEPIDLAPYVLELETVLPAEDLDDLGLIAVRKTTPEAVTAKNRMRLGLAASLDQRAKEEGEAAPTADDFRGLDNDAGRAAPGANGPSLQLLAERQDQPGPDPGRNAAIGSARGASAGSGSLPSSSDG